MFYMYSSGKGSTKRSLQFSTARNGGQFKLEIARRSLCPAFSTINGGAPPPPVYSFHHQKPPLQSA